MPNILGISCSLRNARFGAGSQKLIEEVTKLPDQTALKEYLKQQTKIRADDFFEAGRKDGEPFDEIYRNLQTAKGDRGLSNSEAALVAGLWGAHQSGANIMHTGLAQYFPMSGVYDELDHLKSLILQCDALLLSGPVYFGDRGSLAEELIKLFHRDKELAEHIKNKVYGGITVGAKRNGGQETTLIYQLIDTANLNMLAVGNNSETTAQYGGTAWAGDVGTLWEDDYGIDTSIGTGKRVAYVSGLLDSAKKYRLKDEVKVAIWLLQDSPDKKGLNYLTEYCQKISEGSSVEFMISDFTEEEIYRCIACDICPTELSHLDQYGCIIKSKTDLFYKKHSELVAPDAILLAAYSPIDRSDILSVYQKFIERTRYFRRNDFVLTDRLVAPFVISEINSNQNLHLRMLTSLIRHHTILHHPILAMELEGKILNWDYALGQGRSFIENAERVTVGQLTMATRHVQDIKYNPLGYMISAEKLKADKDKGVAENRTQQRLEALQKSKAERIIEID